MFNRLMGWSIFAKANRVMGHNINGALLHQSRQPDRRAAIIGKDKEGATIRNGPAMQGNAVHRRRHTMFTHPKMDIVASIIISRENAVRVHFGIIGAGQIR